MAGSIDVRVNLANLPEVKRAIAAGSKKVTAAMKSGATKGARKTLPAVKSNLAKQRRTGQLEKSQGVKFKGYGNGWTVMLGARKYFRSHDQNRGMVDPVKYGHLAESGRGPVQLGIKKNKKGVRGLSGTTGQAMPIFVKKFDPTKRDPAGVHPMGGPITNGKYTGRSFGANRLVTYGRKGAKGGAGLDRFRRVPGGFLVFSKNAKKATGTKWLAKEQTNFGNNIQAGVTQEIQNKIP
jgi:hypothetical protein